MEPEVYFSPKGRALERIKSEIDNATRSIDLAMYLINTAYLTRALIQAHNRGVSLRIILDRKEAKKSYSTAPRLMQADIPTRFLSPRRGLFHHKFMLIESQILIAGSGNYTNDMEWRNYEAILILYEPVLTEKFLAEFERLWAKATPVLNGRMRQRPKYHKHRLPSGKSYWHPISFGHRIAG